MAKGLVQAPSAELFADPENGVRRAVSLMVHKYRGNAELEAALQTNRKNRVGGIAGSCGGAALTANELSDFN
jgi:hypothetical protein